MTGINRATIPSEGGPAGFDGQDMVPVGEGLWRNGVLRFAVGPGAFAGGYDVNGNLTSRVVDGLCGRGNNVRAGRRRRFPATAPTGATAITAARRSAGR
jgi:hypothetical protein